MNEIFFLKPSENEVGKKVLKKILEIINNSKQVLFCISYFTHLGIADAIINRIKQKKRTFIIVNSHDILRPDGPNKSTIHVSAALLKLFENLGDVYERNGKKFNQGYSDELENPVKIRLLGRDSKSDPLQSIMHHKFIVGDNKIVAFGSLNYTFSAFQNNFENICF